VTKKIISSDILDDIRNKEEFLSKVNILEEGLFRSKLLRKEGWKIDQRRKRSPKLANIGLEYYRRFV
jgi:hypothetical protein